MGLWYIQWSLIVILPDAASENPHYQMSIGPLVERDGNKSREIGYRTLKITSSIYDGERPDLRNAPHHLIQRQKPCDLTVKSEVCMYLHIYTFKNFLARQIINLPTVPIHPQNCLYLQTISTFHVTSMAPR